MNPFRLFTCLKPRYRIWSSLRENFVVRHKVSMPSGRCLVTWASALSMSLPKHSQTTEVHCPEELIKNVLCCGLYCDTYTNAFSIVIDNEEFPWHPRKPASKCRSERVTSWKIDIILSSAPWGKSVYRTQTATRHSVLIFWQLVRMFGSCLLTNYKRLSFNWTGRVRLTLSETGSKAQSVCNFI